MEKLLTVIWVLSLAVAAIAGVWSLLAGAYFEGTLGILLAIGSATIIVKRRQLYA